jgi:hypothetical protein
MKISVSTYCRVSNGINSILILSEKLFLYEELQNCFFESNIAELITVE